jgi:hypothetical protein
MAKNLELYPVLNSNFNNFNQFVDMEDENGKYNNLLYSMITIELNIRC